MQELIPFDQVAEIVRANEALSTALFVSVVVIGGLQRMLGPRDDWVEQRRKRIALKTHEFATMIGAFSIRQLSSDEYAGRVEVDTDRLGTDKSVSDIVERALYQQGIHRNMLASKKYRMNGSERLYTDSSWAKRDHLLAKRQLHIHIVPVPGETAVDLYCHEEPSPIRYPLRHLAVDAMEYNEAITNLHEILEKTGLEYEVRKPPN